MYCLLLYETHKPQVLIGPNEKEQKWKLLVTERLHVTLQPCMVTTPTQCDRYQQNTRRAENGRGPVTDTTKKPPTPPPTTVKPIQLSWLAKPITLLVQPPVRQVAVNPSDRCSVSEQVGQTPVQMTNQNVRQTSTSMDNPSSYQAVSDIYMHIM